MSYAVEFVSFCLREMCALAFLWLPLVFAAYAIGRRRVGLGFIFAAISAEAAAVAYLAYLIRQ